MFTREQAKAQVNSTDVGIAQVVFIEVTWEQFIDWAYDRGWVIFPVPSDEDDAPTFTIAPKSMT